MADLLQCHYATYNNSVYDTGNDNETFKIILTTVSIVITVFVILANSMLIFGLYKINKKLTLSNKLFVYLSFIDVLMVTASFVNSNLIHFIINPTCDMIFYLVTATITFNLLSFQIFWTISTIRYLSIKKPLLQINVWFVNLALLLEVLFAFVFGFCHILSVKMSSFFNVIVLMCIFLFYALSFPFVITLNMKACYSLKLCQRRSKNWEIDSSGIDTSTTSKRKQEAAKTLVMISFSYSICNLPLLLLSIINTVGIITGKSFALHVTEIMNFLSWFMLLNLSLIHI